MALQGGGTCWDPNGQAPLSAPSGAPEAKTHPGALGRLLGVQVFCDLAGQEDKGVLRVRPRSRHSPAHRVPPRKIQVQSHSLLAVSRLSMLAVSPV